MERFEEMLGRTITEIVVDNKPYDDKITFTFDDGSTAWLYHSQECSEDVRIEEIHGDLDDLVGTPLLLVEEAVYDNTPDPEGRTGDPADYRWTFYKLATVKGYVTLRWLGESNGYYGTDVDFGWSA